MVVAGMLVQQLLVKMVGQEEEVQLLQAHLQVVKEIRPRLIHHKVIVVVVDIIALVMEVVVVVVLQALARRASMQMPVMVELEQHQLL